MIPTTVDPTMSPPGKHFMSVFVQYVPYQLAEGPWTPEMKAQYEKDVLDTIELHAPGLQASWCCMCSAARPGTSRTKSA